MTQSAQQTRTLILIDFKLDIVEFLKSGLIKNHYFINKPVQELIDLFSNPDEIESYEDVGLYYYHYSFLRFLISKQQIIESVSMDGSFLDKLKNLTVLLKLLAENNLDFLFDLERSDEDYLFLKVCDNCQIIYDLYACRIFRIAYPYI